MNLSCNILSLRYTACVSLILIYCNMVDSVVIFITLYNYSTVLSIFMIPCIRSLLFLKIILFLAALGLHCCAGAFLSFGEQGLLFTAVHELLFAEHRLQVHLLQ